MGGGYRGSRGSYNNERGGRDASRGRGMGGGYRGRGGAGGRGGDRGGGAPRLNPLEREQEKQDGKKNAIAETIAMMNKMKMEDNERKVANQKYEPCFFFVC